MVYNAKMEIQVDGSSVLMISGGVDGEKCHLQFELPNEKKSIKGEWSKKDIVKYGSRDLQEGFPLKITIDGTQLKSLYYRNRFLYEPGESNPWSSHIPPWTDLWSKLDRGTKALPEVFFDPILVETKDLESYAGCVASFGTAGAAIGGGFGGPGGLVTGGAIGAAFGAGYCAAK